MKWDLCELNDKKGAYLYGAGEYGKYIYDLIKKHPLKIEGFIDSYSNSTTVRSICVHKDIIKKDGYAYIVSVSRVKDKLEIINKLRSAGIDENDIFVPIVPKGNRFFDPEIIKNQELCKLFLEVQIRFHKFLADYSIEEYFKSNGINKLAIYGDKDISMLLRDELMNCGIQTMPYEEKVECDEVIVMDVTHFAEIEEMLMEQIKVPIINIWEIIRNT